ncbi:MAG: RIP metalloprotease [Alphaproteobacteria bacterium]|nr:RIP metalloprotease [Alphaproteobacteria bacterium]
MGGILVTIFWFLIVLTPLVFVHEFGHYWVARRNGVRVETFSVGFGREIFGWTDSHGTRWKFSLIPFGGYVKMFGQSDIGPDLDDNPLTPEEKAVSFSHKRLGQKAAIVAAGPIANIIFAILIFIITFATVGQGFTPARITEVLPDTPAEAAGFQEGDLFVEVAGRKVERFEEVQLIISLHPGLTITVIVERDGAEIPIEVTPRVEVEDDPLGGEQRRGLIGVRGTEREFQRHNPIQAVWQSLRETGRMISLTATSINQMFAGDRSAKELGGPIRIAQMSGSAAASPTSLIFFAAFLSINLGLINLLPIPLLDGGHLLFYAYEVVFRRPPHPWVVDFGLKIGLVLVLSLMLFATYNDLARLPVVQRLVALIT